jgi:hypothetical protein
MELGHDTTKTQFNDTELMWKALTPFNKELNKQLENKENHLKNSSQIQKLKVTMGMRKQDDIHKPYLDGLKKDVVEIQSYIDCLYKKNTFGTTIDEAKLPPAVKNLITNIFTPVIEPATDAISEKKK